MSDSIYQIYKLTSPSGKSYIGQTNNLARRITAHKYSTSKCTFLKHAIKKYGFKNFTLTTLSEGLTLEDANEVEEQFIDEYNTLAPNGYNLHTGGANHKCSEETKRKISEANKGKPSPTKGMKWSEESKQKLSKSKIGHECSEATKQKIAIKSTGRYHSEETKQKISENSPNLGKPAWNRGITLSDEHKTNLSKSISKGKVKLDGVVYNSTKEACILLKIPRSTLQSRFRSPHWDWNYVKEDAGVL